MLQVDDVGWMIDDSWLDEEIRVLYKTSGITLRRAPTTCLPWPGYSHHSSVLNFVLAGRIRHDGSVSAEEMAKRRCPDQRKMDHRDEKDVDAKPQRQNYETGTSTSPKSKHGYPFHNSRLDRIHFRGGSQMAKSRIPATAYMAPV